LPGRRAAGASLAAATAILFIISCGLSWGVSGTLMFSDRPYAETPLPSDYGSDDEISLSWSTEGHSSPRITSTGECPFSDHSPDGINRFIFAQGTTVIQFDPTVRLIKVFVRDNEPDFLQQSASGLTVKGGLENVPVFSETVDFVPHSSSGVWIEVNGDGAIDTLQFISADDLTKSYLIDDLEFEIYSETEVIALAGHNRSVLEGSTVTLDGSGSVNADSFSWTQVIVGEEPEVTLASPNEALTTFVAPDVETATTFTFELTASGPLPLERDTDRVEIVVNISSAPDTAPQELTILPREGEGMLKAVVEWSVHPDATRYVVYRAEEDPQNEYVKVAPALSSVSSYEDDWLEQGMIYFYKVAGANQFGVGPVSEAVGFVARRNLAFDTDAVPKARILNPTGSGLRDIEAIRNGLTEENYDSYHGGITETEDWYGYLWQEPRYFDTVVYYEGENFHDGGWWTSLTIQYTSDGKNWIEVEELSISPAYNFEDVREGRVNYTRFLLTFVRCQGIGIRIYGEPGGVADFTSIAELEVYGDQAPNIVIANAGADFQADEGTVITLHGDNSLNAEGFWWEQVIIGHEPEVVLTAADTPNPTLVVEEVSSNTVLTFRLTVTGFHGPKSDIVNVTVVNKEQPGPTEGLTATGGDRRVELSWQPNEDATSYKLVRNTVPGGGGVVVATDITTTSYIDSDLSLKPYRTYFYQVAAVNRYGEGPGSNVAAAVPIENFAMYPDAGPIAMITEPTGSGQRDLNVIRNGVFDEKGYDSFDGANPAEKDWYGYFWKDPIYPDRVIYTMGQNYLDGGWWTSLTVEYTTDEYTTDGITWLEAPGVTITPPYNFEDDPAARPDYSQYTLTFDRVRARGLRIAGTPGGFAQFTSIVELEVYGLDAAVVGQREIVPLFYTPGGMVSINLAIEVHEPPAPDSLSVTERVPQEVAIVNRGGGTIVAPGEIRWNLGPGEVGEKDLSYTIAIPSDFSGGLSFHGWLSYGDVTKQRIRGEDSLYPKPLPPKNLRLEMTLAGHLRWSPVLDEGIAGYHVYRSVKGQGYEDISGLIADASFDDFDVEREASYRYKVTVENVLGVESSLTESPPVGPASVVMLRREFEDYNYGQGLFPGGEGLNAVRASNSDDLSGDKDYFFHDPQANNTYRPADAADIREFGDGGYFVAGAGEGDWWRFSLDLQKAGYVKIADLRAASSEEATYEFFWDETPVGKFSFHTGGEINWQTHQMDIPAFLSPAGVHTLRIHITSGISSADFFGIGFDSSPPAREAIFADGFDQYSTTEEVSSLGGWTIINGSGESDGAWQLWNTNGPPLAEGEPGPDFPGFTSGYMVSNGDFAGDVELDEQLISPEIDCTRYTCVAVQFVSAMNIYEQDEHEDLQTTDLDMSFYDETSESWSGWVNLFTRDRTAGDRFSAVAESFDVSSLADGRKIKFRWRFHNTRYDFWWAVDDVRVTGENRPPRIISAALTPEGLVHLSWENFGSGPYTVESSDDLPDGEWQPVPGTQWPIDDTTWQGDDISPGRRRFYRVTSE